jgi:hypothetical protein
MTCLHIPRRVAESSIIDGLLTPSPRLRPRPDRFFRCLIKIVFCTCLRMPLILFSYLRKSLTRTQVNRSKVKTVKIFHTNNTFPTTCMVKTCSATDSTKCILSVIILIKKSLIAVPLYLIWVMPFAFQPSVTISRIHPQIIRETHLSI